MKNDYEDRNYEELSNFAVSFAGSRIMPSAVLGGFTLSTIIFLLSISQPIEEHHWSDTLAIIFYICFILFILTSILFNIYGGQAQKLMLQNLELSEKKNIVLKIINRIFIVNKMLIFFIQIFKKIYFSKKLFALPPAQGPSYRSAVPS